MKAVILAAGLGSRLGSRTKAAPKGLLQVGTTSLLQRSLDAISKQHIQECIIVTGHCHEMLPEALGYSCSGMPLTYVHNEAYATTGSTQSLLCAREAIGDHTPILLLESDLLYESRALAHLTSERREDTLLTAPLLHSGDDVYIVTKAHDAIALLGKQIPEREKATARGCLVGISKLSASFLTLFFNEAQNEASQGQPNRHYEETILSTSHKHKRPVYASYIEALHWTEIDNEQDLRRAREEVWPAIASRL